MLFDLSGTRHDTPMKTMKIDLITNHGVIGEEANHLDPSENPHTVSDYFGRLLIAGDRAVEHDPKNPIKPAPKESDEVKAPAGVQKRDPKATNRDPK